MANLLLSDTDAAALLWAIENTVEDQAEWFEEHRPSEYGAEWLRHAMEIRLRLERIAIMLRERAWPDWKRAEGLAARAGALAAEILGKCARESMGGESGKEKHRYGAA